jgi:hypothetical protein
MSRLRNLCFTLNNWTDQQYQPIITLDVKYLVVGKEVGESRGLHICRVTLEDKEGEGSWKSVARPSPSTLGRHSMIEHK